MYFGSKNVLCCLIYIACSSSVLSMVKPRRDMSVVHGWSQIEYDYPSEAARQADIDSGRFREGTIVPIDCDVYYSGNESTIFITTPRWHSGTPVTIGTVTNRTRNGNPVIAPYPSWSWHNNSERCPDEGISSIFRMMIDECGRLWVVDIGIRDNYRCPSRLLAFDLRTNQLIVRYEIPSRLLQSNSILVTPVVDVIDQADSCRNTFVYIADARGFQIIVYDLQHNDSWAAHDRTMYPYPNYGIGEVEGEPFYVMDGIVGMALTPKRPRENRRLYYHAVNSLTENWVYTSFLKNSTIFRNNSEAAPQIFHTYRNTRSALSSAEAFDRNGILYYGLIDDVKIACFHVGGVYASKYSSAIVADNPVTLQFPTGLKVITDPQGVQKVWTLTSRFQKLLAGTMYLTNETNFRILAASVDQLVSGTPCRRSQRINDRPEINPSIYLPNLR